MVSLALEPAECRSCPLLDTIDELARELDATNRIASAARAEIVQSREDVDKHVRSAYKSVFRLKAEIEHAQASMEDLTSGLMDLAATVRVDMRRRATKARPKKAPSK